MGYIFVDVAICFEEDLEVKREFVSRGALVISELVVMAGFNVIVF